MHVLAGHNTSGCLYREFDKISPERVRSPCFIGMKRVGGTLPLPRFVRRSLRRKVEMQDLEPR